MKPTAFFLSLLSCTLLLTCSPLASHFDADGYVADKSTKMPVAKADVTLAFRNKGTYAQTDENGHFRIALDIFPDSSEAAVLSISKEGFRHFSKTVYARFSSSQDTFFLERN